MALILKDRVKETTTTTGTGTITLAGASIGYQSFSAIGNTNTTYYCIAGQGTTEWEVGIGTYTASGTTLSRDTILASSNSGSAVTFSAGTKDVFVVYPAGKSVNLDASGNATALGTPASGVVTNLTGTASININGTVGATTPTTGAFTTLTTSSTVTLNGGTANGVLYLNGSKVATSGSALVFDGTNLGVGTSSPTSRLHVSNSTASTNAIAQFTNGTTGTGAGNGLYVGIDTSNEATVYNFYNSALKFGTNGVERMRLDSSGNVGIGTSSPEQSLDVNGSIQIPTGSAGAIIKFKYAGDTNSRSWAIANDQTAFGDFAIKQSTTQTGTAWDYKLYISPSGNVGIGTSSPGTKLDVRGTANASDGTNGNVRMYVDASYGFFQSLNQAANAYRPLQLMGSTISLANNGTINAILDSSGNLGLGVTPSAWSGVKAFQVNTTGALWANSSTLFLTNNTFTDGTDKYLTTAAATRYYQAAGSHIWNTAPSGTAGNNVSFTQAMTLDASGNLLVGTTTATSKVTVGGTSDVRITINETGGSVRTDLYSQTGTGGVGTQSNHPFQLFTNGSERMRIDSSGNLFLGITTQPVSTYKMVLEYSGNSSNGGIMFNDTDGGQTYEACYFRKDGSQRGYIRVTTSGTTYATVSDYRLKENVAPMTGALAKVAALKPCVYTWKDSGIDSQGFIAHELQAVVPECVTGEKDAVDADGNPVYQGIDTSFLVATLTAAIKELKEELDAVKAELATLKGN